VRLQRVLTDTFDWIQAGRVAPELRSEKHHISAAIRYFAESKKLSSSEMHQILSAINFHIGSLTGAELAYQSGAFYEVKPN
jgi:hypothetical protein